MSRLWLPPGIKPNPAQRVDWDALGVPNPVGAWYFSEGTGNTVYDVSGYGHHATNTGGTWETGGPYGPALLFGSGTKTLDAPTNATLTTNITAWTWLYTARVDDGSDYLSQLYSHSSAQVPKGLHFDFSGNRAIIYPENSCYRYFNHTVDLDDGNWHMIAATLPGPDAADLSNALYYADGIALTVNTTDSTGSQAAKDRCRIVTFFYGAVAAAVMFPVALPAKSLSRLSLPRPLPIWIPQRYWFIGDIIKKIIPPPLLHRRVT